jgi:hypothetical protein
MEIKQSCFKKLQTALIFFGQVTVGMSRAFQLCHIGLFAALEALFVPSGNKASTLAKRVSSFLSSFQFPEPMENWIENEYKHGRNKLVHGIHDATFGASMSPARSKAFGRLHEITRLCLLGFLSIADCKLKELYSSEKSLKCAIDNLGAATGQYLQGQKMWLD